MNCALLFFIIRGLSGCEEQPIDRSIHVRSRTEGEEDDDYVEEEDGDGEDDDDEDDTAELAYLMGARREAPRFPKLPETVAPLDYPELEAVLLHQSRPVAGRDPVPPALRPSSSGRPGLRLTDLVRLRETGYSSLQPSRAASRSGMSPSTLCSTQLRHLPSTASKIIAQRRSRGYCGQFSRDGKKFVAAFQDREARLWAGCPPLLLSVAAPLCLARVRGP